MKHVVWKILASSAVLLGIVVWPSDYHRMIGTGTDSYNTHYQISGSRTKTFAIISDAPVRGIGLLVVNMRRANSLPPLHVIVSSNSVQEPMAQDVSLHDVQDDEFTWIRFPKTIATAGEEFSVTVSAPQANAASVVGIRFDANTKQPALGLIQSVPLWKYIVLWSQDNPDAAKTLFTTIIGGILLTVIGLGVEYAQRVRRWVVGASFLLLICFTLYLRIPLASSIDSAYGGDAFNYLLKSRALIDGQDPFTADPRKAPLYSFLVAPGLAMPFDAVVWERWVSMLSAAGIVVLVPLFLLEFGAPLSLALIAGALIAVNRDVQFESVQGLSNTLYAFLVLLASYLFMRGKSYAVAVCASLATLTRYEGGAVAAILVPASISPLFDKEREGLPAGQAGVRWIRFGHALIPIVILLSIPFILFPFTGQLGVRTVSDIQGDSGLYLAYSLDDFMNNLQGFKNLFGRLWLQVQNIGNPFMAFWIGVGAGTIILGKHLRRVSPLPNWGEGGGEGRSKTMPSVLPSSAPFAQRLRANLLPNWGEGSAIIPYLLLIFLLFTILRGPSEHIVFLFSCLTGIGTVALIALRPKYTIPIAIAIAVQIIAITIILPKDRYYLPVIPFVAIAIAIGVAFVSNAKKSRIGLAGSLLFIGCMTAFTYHDASRALIGQVSDYNEKSAGQTVLLNAARYLKHVSGIVAVADGSDLQLRTYLPADRVVILPDSLRDIEKQLAELQYRHVTYIVNTTENPYFTKLLEAHPERFTEVRTLTTKWSKTTATVYWISY